jgi:hypothetical protein
MHFIEHIFHVSPDNGTGLTEIIFLAVLVAAPLVLLRLRNKSKRGSSSSFKLP